MFCSNCGNKVGDNARFCGVCGTKLTVTPVRKEEGLPVKKKESKKSRIVMMLILFALMAVVASVAIMYGMRKKNANGPHIDKEFIREFPFQGSFEDAREWLEDNENYTCKKVPPEQNMQLEGKSKEHKGWEYYVAGSVYGYDGNFVQFGNYDERNTDTIYRKCRRELEKLCGNPDSGDENSMVYYYNNIRIDLLNLDDCVVMWIGRGMY